MGNIIQNIKKSRKAKREHILVVNRRIISDYNNKIIPAFRRRIKSTKPSSSQRQMLENDLQGALSERNAAQTELRNIEKSRFRRLIRHLPRMAKRKPRVSKTRRPPRPKKRSNK